jgi:hypothetical protein
MELWRPIEISQAQTKLIGLRKSFYGRLPAGVIDF